MKTKYNLLQNKYIWPLLVASIAVALGFTSTVVGWKIYLAATALAIACLIAFGFTAEIWIVMVAVISFSYETWIPGTGTQITIPTEALIPVLIVVTATTVLLKGKIVWTANRLNAPVALFVLVVLLTLIVSRDRIVTLKAIIRDLTYIFAGYLLIRSYMVSPRRLKQLLIARTIFTTLIILFGLYTQFKEGVKIYQVIAEPFFLDHAVYASFLALDFAMLCAFVLAYPKSPLRPIGFVLLGLWGFAIAITFVRGAWISLAAMGVFYVYLYRKAINLKLIIALLLLIVISVMVIGGLQLSELFAQRMTTITDIKFLTNYDRIDRWMAAISIFNENPVLGVGWGRYADEYFQHIYYTDTYNIETRMGAHNLYLETAAESGIIGLIAFLVLIIFFAIESRRLWLKCNDLFLKTVLTGTIGAMITYLVHAFVNNLGPSDKIGVSVWVLFGLVPVIGRLMEKSVIKTDN